MTGILIASIGLWVGIGVVLLLVVMFIGLYNGLTTLIGGGFGPFVVAGIIDGGAGTRDLLTIFGLCVAIALLLLAFSRRVHY